MHMHQAMKVPMPAMVTGVIRYHQQVKCDLSVVHSGAQSRFILEALRSRHCQRLQSLVVQGPQGSGQHRLRRCRGTLMLMCQYSHGKQWDDPM